MKGQAELVIILAVLVIGVIVLVYLVQLGVLGGGGPLDQNQRLVKESIEGSIRAAAIETMREVFLHGGYTEPQQNFVFLNGERVPYWEYNGQSGIPDYRTNLANGIKSHLMQNKAVLERAVSASDVAIQDPQQVTVSILPDSIEVSVTMPTSMKGAGLPQPYRVSIPSMMGEALEFSQKFLEGQRQDRFFEQFTLSSMLLTELDGEVQKTPFVVVLSECGKSVHRTYDDVKQEAETVVKRTLAHTYMPGKYPESVIELTGYPKYSLTPLGGKDYSGLDVSFWTPDSFSLNRNSFQFSPEPISTTAKIIPFTGSCQSEPIYVHYSMNYPVITRVKDTLTGIPLQFAFNVLIIDNAAAPYENLPGLEPTHCANPQCSMDIRVVDSQGIALDGAYATFLGCGIGETTGGRLQARIPCGLGPLLVTKDRYSPYFDTHAPQELANKEVTLSKMPLANLKFWEVNVRNESPTYRILPGVDRNSDINPLRDDLLVTLTFFSQESGIQLYPLTFDSSGGILDLPVGSYTVQGAVFDQDYSKSYGAFITILDVTESLDGSELNIYLPYTITYSDANTDEARFLGALTLTSLLELCNLGPIRTSEVQTFAGCVKQEGDLLA